MEWRGRRQSGNVVDRRGVRVAGGVGGIGLIIAIIYALMGGDPGVILNQAQQTSDSSIGASGSRAGGSGADEQKEFVSVVLADTEDVWRQQFQALGRQYRDPKLVLFTNHVNSACGQASSAVGPFYCPSDQQVYLDLAFFSDLQHQLGAKGDFARAYVIAHEVGHHVQNLLGISSQVQAAERHGGERQRNRLSVMLELQADCLAGVWAKQTETAKHVLEKGDIEEAVTAAAAVGDDRLQKLSRGYVVPDSFTHGSSQQRVDWFKRGFAHGDANDCDTFTAGP